MVVEALPGEEVDVFQEEDFGALSDQTVSREKSSSIIDRTNKPIAGIIK